MNEVDGLDPADVFTAIFSMFFGAQQAGLAQMFSGDVGTAKQGAERIFDIMDQKSRIDACAIDEDSSKVRI